ncbi:unnamed protein product [Parajaminaea phylloscopi]
MASRSFFAPEAGETRLNMGTAAASHTTEYGRQSPPPSDPRGDEDRKPFLPTSSDDAALAKQQRAGLAPASTASESLSGVKALPPILSYCAASITMTVVNKFVLSGQKFSMNLVVLLIQSAVGALCVIAANKLGWIELRAWNYRDARNWTPISALLVLTIWTGSKALQYLNIPVYTIFKNLTIILIAYGEVIWFGGRVTLFAFSSFCLMVLSSIIAAWSDISHTLAIAQLSMPHTPDSISEGKTFDPNTHRPVAAFDPLSGEKARLTDLQAGGMGALGGTDGDVLDGMRGWGVLNSGYMWMALNCFASAALMLAMRKRIKVTGFKDWDTMYYNNLFSIPILLVMSLVAEDWSRASWETNFPADRRTSLLSAIVFSGACAVFIGYTTAWCVRTTSSTTYSMVGALNKLPLAVSGMVFFHDPPVTLGSVSAILVGFLAGIVYALAKNAQVAAQKRAAAAAAAAAGSSEAAAESASSLAQDGHAKGDLASGAAKHGATNGSAAIPMQRLDERGDRDRRRED